DGIRDDLVTGVQTCALPICGDVGDAHLGIACQAVGGRVQDRGDVAAGVGPLCPRGHPRLLFLEQSCMSYAHNSYTSVHVSSGTRSVEDTFEIQSRDQVVWGL